MTRTTTPPGTSLTKSTGIAKVIPGKLARVLYKIEKFALDYGGDEEVRTRVGIDEAVLVSSQLADSKLHAPVLDIDVPHALVPSSTPGHSHLYIDVPMSWRRYKKLLRQLAKAGIVEPGYVKASLSRRHTSVRAPWVSK